ncbi:MAG TPA: histidine phosphatase family protein [Thermoguttaceae bacterium]|nr:histidine phosphatase family protein [Thermoguttaceae bacterium]
MTPQDSTICYLIRHGATENNEQNPPVLQGQRLDLGLSAAGRDQAERLASFLTGRAIDAVYASPLRRAVETAKAIADPHHLPVEVIDGLIEVDVGEWEGLDWNQIRQNDPAAYEAFMSDAAANGYLGGECLAEVFDRTAPVLNALLADNTGRRIVVVAHNVVNRVYLAWLLGMPPAQYRTIPQENTGLNVLRFRGGKARIITLNSVFHLE